MDSEPSRAEYAWRGEEQEGKVTAGGGGTACTSATMDFITGVHVLFTGIADSGIDFCTGTGAGTGSGSG